MFPLRLVKIGQIVKKWQQLFEIQDYGGRHLELWLRRFFRRHRCDLNQSSNIPTKFGDDWSNSKEMATVFLNSRWRLVKTCCENVTIPVSLYAVGLQC